MEFKFFAHMMQYLNTILKFQSMNVMPQITEILGGVEVNK